MNRRIIIRFLFAAIAAGCLAYVLLFHVFTLKELNIIGDSKLTSPEVMEIAGLKFGMQIRQVDEEIIRQRIDALGTVKLQEANMGLNGVLELNICRREAAAMVTHNADILVLDGDLCVVRRIASVPAEDLILISGMEAPAYLLGKPYPSEPEKRECCASLLQALIQNRTQACISEIDVDRLDRIVLITENGTWVQMGEAENATDKLGFLKAVLSDLEKNNRSGGEILFFDTGKADYRPTSREQEFDCIT